LWGAGPVFDQQSLLHARIGQVAGDELTDTAGRSRYCHNHDRSP
jgi:hypothetical protein